MTHYYTGPTVPAPDWSEARCVGMDQRIFFPERGVQIRELNRAKAICASCPVKAECLAFARANGEGYGIWGGVVFGKPAGGARARRRLESAT